MQIASTKINAGKIKESAERISKATGKMLEENFNSNMQWFSEVSNALGISSFGFGKKDDCCDACPPHCDCPPHCLISIKRDAYHGEIIIVPFKVKNTLQAEKKYQVGVRPFYDDNGTPLPNQPVLSKTELDLQPGQTMLVAMRIDLASGYVAGNTYTTEIVIREKDVNQNICFTLNVMANTFIPEAHPLKEQDYFNHFQDWKSHYYCEAKPTINRITVNPIETNLDIKR